MDFNHYKPTINILYWALIASRGIFAFVLIKFIAPTADPTIEDGLVVNVIFGVATIVGLVSYYLFKKIV